MRVVIRSGGSVICSRRRRRATRKPCPRSGRSYKRAPISPGGSWISRRWPSALRERHGIEYAHPDGVGQLLRRRKVKLKRGRPRHEEADQKEQQAFKKLRRRGRAGGRWPRQTVEGFGFRRGTLRADQLAQEALLPEGVPAALHREALLRVDLPLRRGGAHHGGELLPVPAWDGRRMPADIPQRALEGLPRKPPASSARRRSEPPLREDRPSGEREPPRAAGLLPGAGPGGEVVPGVQKKVVQHDVRERRSNARGAHPDAFALLERPRAPQTAHRIPLVGGGGGGIVTSIARNGIRRGILRTSC